MEDKITRRAAVVTALGGVAAFAFFASRSSIADAAARPAGAYKLTDAQWKAKLSPAAYKVLRHANTERPGTSALLNEHRSGTFHCAGCDWPLYSSKTKYDSGTGWPSFWQVLPGAIGSMTDYETGSPRTEVHCRNCGGHLGHVFDDGPKPTSKRFCMNGVALIFKPGTA
ncbi:MAG: peptide-methionine (R)-S-oxide reductase MsrB [Novosphingobium sp.]